MRILVNLIGGGIGNFVMTVPLLKILKKKLNCKIYVLVDEGKSIFLKNESYIDGFFYYNRKSSFFKKLNIIFKLYKHNFDYSIVPLPKSGYVTLLDFLIHSKKRISHDIQKFKFLYTDLIKYNFKHDVIDNLKFLDYFDINYSKKDVDLSLNLYDSKYLFKSSKKIIGIHPGSEGVYKRWSFRKFNSLIKKLLKKNIVFIFLGPSEKEFKFNIKSKNLYVFRLKDIFELYSKIKSCDLFLSNDSGIMHLAVSAKVKTIGLFGPTNPLLTGPYGISNKFIKYNLKCDSKDRICKNKVNCKFKCLSSISVDEVYELICKIS